MRPEKFGWCFHPPVGWPGLRHESSPTEDGCSTALRPLDPFCPPLGAQPLHDATSRGWMKQPEAGAEDFALQVSDSLAQFAKGPPPPYHAYEQLCLDSNSGGADAPNAHGQASPSCFALIPIPGGGCSPSASNRTCSTLCLDSNSGGRMLTNVPLPMY